MKITCRSCNQVFEWTDQEQQRYRKNGWLPPKKCFKCRNMHKKYFKAKVRYLKTVRESSINDSKLK